MSRQVIKKNAVALLVCFQIGFAGMIDPPGRVATFLGIDYMAVVEMEVEGVIGLTRVVRVDALGFFPGDDLALILKHRVASLDGKDGVEALAVDDRFAHLSAASTGTQVRVGMCLTAGRFYFILGLCQLKKAPPGGHN